MLYLQQQGKELFAAMDNHIIQLVAYFLSPHAQIVDQYRHLDSAFDLEAALAAWASKVILKQNSENQFFYSYEARSLATQALAPHLGPVVDWQYDNRKKLAGELYQLLSHKMGQAVDEVDVENLPREKRQWLLNELAILNALY